jgi:hypothetical protein
MGLIYLSSEENKLNFCYVCNKKTDIVCVDCKKPICAKHSYPIRHAIKCPQCTRQGQIKNLIIRWGIIAGMIIMLVLALIYLRN